MLALDPSKLDFAKPKHKRLLEIDDNFENFSFEEVNAVANPTTITPSLLLYVVDSNIRKQY